MNDETPVFSPRVAAILVGAGTLLFLAAILLSGFGDDWVRSYVRRPGAIEKNAVGFAALRTLVEKTGGGGELAAGGVDAESVDHLLILTPDLATRPEDITAILENRARSAQAAADADAEVLPIFPTLVILPKWQVEPLPLQRNRVRATGEIFDGRLNELLKGIGIGSASITSANVKKTGPVAGSGLRPFLLSPGVRGLMFKDARPLIAGPDRSAVLAQVGERPVYVLADPDLLNNRAMKPATNASAGLRLLAALDPDGGGEVRFDTSLHYRPGSRNLVRLLFTPPFLGVTLATVAAALLAAWAGLVRFGPVRREGRAVAAGKRALADNIAALTRRAGRLPAIGEVYADAQGEALARRAHLPRGASLEARLRALDNIDPERPYSPLDARLRDARSEAALLEAARGIQQWRKEVM